MKNWIIAGIILITFLLVYLFAPFLEEIDSNPYRIVSYSSDEAKENHILLNKYKLRSNQDSLFFIVKEAWTQKSVSYLDNKIHRIFNGELFVLSVDIKKKSKLFAINWTVEVDGAIGGQYSGGDVYIFFYKQHFDDKIFVKIKLLEKEFNKTGEIPILNTFEFVKN